MQSSQQHALRTLLLDTRRRAQTGPSGYSRVADYIPDSTLVSASRSDPSGLFLRLATRILRLGSASNWYRIGSLKMELSARRAIKSQHFDVVHVLWGDSDWGYIHHILPQSTSFVVTLHNPPDLLHQNFHRPEVLNRVDRFILMSPDQGEYLARNGICESKYHFLPHGIDTDHFTPSSLKSTTISHTIKLLHVGSYLRDFDQLAHLTNELTHLPVKFQVVCPQSIPSSHDFAPGVEWHHNISHTRLRELYQDADVLIMTGLAATANNAILEGMACGLPIIAPEMGGLRNYTDPTFAKLFPSSDNGAFVKAIVQLLEDPQRRTKMAEAARRAALRFSWPAIADQTASVYRESVLAKRR